MQDIYCIYFNFLCCHPSLQDKSADKENTTSSAVTSPPGPAGTSTSPAGGADAEVTRLEQRLIFPGDIQQVALAQPGRHVVFTAQLYMAEENKWTKVIKASLCTS